MNALPSLDAKAEPPTEERATGTSDSQVVGLVDQNKPDLSKHSVLKHESETQNGSRLVSPMVSPRTCLNETIQDNSGVNDKISREREGIKKPRETQSNARFV